MREALIRDIMKYHNGNVMKYKENITAKEI